MCALECLLQRVFWDHVYIIGGRPNSWHGALILSESFGIHHVHTVLFSVVSHVWQTPSLGVMEALDIAKNFISKDHEQRSRL